jgi:hypothetical protein
VGIAAVDHRKQRNFGIDFFESCRGGNLVQRQAGEQGDQFGDTAGAQRVAEVGFQREQRRQGVAENLAQRVGFGEIGARRAGRLQLDQFDIGRIDFCLF